MGFTHGFLVSVFPKAVAAVRIELKRETMGIGTRKGHDMLCHKYSEYLRMGISEKWVMRMILFQVDDFIASSGGLKWGHAFDLKFLGEF